LNSGGGAIRGYLSALGGRLQLPQVGSLQRSEMLDDRSGGRTLAMPRLEISTLWLRSNRYWKRRCDILVVLRFSLNATKPVAAL
jgi:hypothetical protein